LTEETRDRREKNMSVAPRFHDLPITRVSPEAAGAVAIAFAVPESLRETFAFEPGQFLTLRAQIGGADVRRSYSICSTRSRFQKQGELEVGIRPMEGGVFSNWAATALKAGDTLAVMPPDGRFTSRRPRALHRVGFAAGSGITPILSILATALEEQPETKFTLVYGNRRMDSVMFNEALQDLKDQYPDRLTLIHILSRQAQEVDLLQGRIDGDKVRAIMDTLLPARSMDEVFVCGPEAMIEATEAALLGAGVPRERVYTERFTSPTLEALNAEQRKAAVEKSHTVSQTGSVALTVVLDGKPHALRMNPEQRVLDVALAAGLDLPWSCRGGVCCTCRAKVMEGSVVMDKNFTLEPWETEKGFVLSCQARPTSDALVVSYDER
jgi:ring-1,2-phenylacetyl-CoA epoxidase subunit PaaE